jgi:flagellar basal-body rod modification protein FlgD
MPDLVTSTLQGLPAVTGDVAPTAKNTLDKDSFLKLLTTQLQKQDPLSPMDSNAFVAQLAQFSQLEGITNLGTKLDSMLLGQANANQMATSQLVGKQVTFRANQVALTSGQATGFDVNLSTACDQGVALVSDAAGRVVRTIQLGGRAAGTSSVAWDGRDEAGNDLPTGNYTVTVAASRVDGAPVTAATFVRGVVANVSFEGAVPELIVAGQHVKLADVTQVGVPNP